MKRIKYLFIIVLLACTKNLSAQKLKVNLKTELSLEKQDCQNENIKKTIEIVSLSGEYEKPEVLTLQVQCNNTYGIELASGSYLAFILIDSYTNIEMPFTVSKDETSIIIKQQFLKQQINELNEVLITREVQVVRTDGNKTIYDVAGNIYLNQGSAYELIQKLPGFMIDLNCKISSKGKATTVYIDGIPVSMDPKELASYLSTINASTIKNIEVVANPGAAYDADVAATVINITTSKQNNSGIYGTLSSSTTFYRETKSENSLSLSGLQNKVTWNATAGWYDIDYLSGMDKLVNDLEYPNHSITDDYLGSITNRGKNLSFSLGIPIHHTTIGLKYNFLDGKETTMGRGYYENDYTNPLTIQNSTGDLQSDRQRNEAIITMRQTLGEGGNFFSLTYRYLSFNRENTLNNSAILNNESLANGYDNDFGSRVNWWKGDLSMPGETYDFNMGFRVNNSRVHSKGEYWEGEELQPQINYNYDDFGFALYSETKMKFNDLSATFGLRYEHINFLSEVNAVGSRKVYDRLFPSINLNYKPSDILELNLSYSSKVRMPNYQDLDPNSSGIITGLFHEVGNPFLDPSFYNNVEFKATVFKYADFTVSYSHADRENYAVLHKKEDHSLVQTVASFTNFQNINTSIGIPVPLGIITKGFNYIKDIKNFSDINLLYFLGGFYINSFESRLYNNSTSNLYYIGGYSQFIMPYKTVLNLQYMLSGKGSYNIYNVEKNFSKLDITLSKAMFDKKLKVQMTFADVFNTGNGYFANFGTDQIDVHVKTITDSQRIRFSLTYNFGGSSSKKETNEETYEDRSKGKTSIGLPTN